MVVVARPIVLVMAAACLLASWVWARSTMRMRRACRRIERDVQAGTTGADALTLAQSNYYKDLHTSALYAILGATALVVAVVHHPAGYLPVVLLLVPVGLSLRYARRLLAAARMAEERTLLERRAAEVLAQEDLAPLRWAERLAPQHLPEVEGFEVGRVYEPGTGAMAGDFYDIFPTGPHRLAAVIGDVSGHGIEPSITAFQVKYLLRVFLRQYRDPGQALEELNLVMSLQARAEELVSLFAVTIDTQSSALRFASAGHPPAWLWQEGEVRPLRSTGPLLTLDPHGTYGSRELSLATGDVLLLYTDGLSEARAGEQLFGEERIASVLRRDPGVAMDTLTKSLLESARDFATGPLTDDIAILAIRRT